jgi:chemotaxis protein histidine kinase CheA
MSKIPQRFALLLFALIICVLPSCKHMDYSKQIHDLDSLHTALSTVSQRYAMLNVVDLGAKVDSVNRHLDYVQKNYVGYQREDMALVLSQYRRVKKLIPDISSANERIKQEINLTLEQLNSLSQALKEGATHDSAGNKMTEEYLDKAFASESKKAGALVQQLDELLDRAPMADSIYNAHYARVRFWVDSIPTLSASNPAVPR